MLAIILFENGLERLGEVNRLLEFSFILLRFLKSFWAEYKL